jgi:hypothetical protein
MFDNSSAHGCNRLRTDRWFPRYKPGLPPDELLQSSLTAQRMDKTIYVKCSNFRARRKLRQTGGLRRVLEFMEGQYLIFWVIFWHILLKVR